MSGDFLQIVQELSTRAKFMTAIVTMEHKPTTLRGKVIVQHNWFYAIELASLNTKGPIIIITGS